MSSKEALDYLSISAPRAWVRRMLLGMIMGNEIRPYVLKGEITPKWTLRAILSDQENFNPNATQAEIDLLVTNLFSEDDAKKMLGRALDDINEEDTISWTRDHAVTVRRQNIWRNLRRRLAEYRPRLGVDIRRRACGAASVDVRWSVA